MLEFASETEESKKDDLFLERLDTFMQKSLGEIRAFAEREGKPYEETRRHIAQWHAKYLFQQRGEEQKTRAERVHAALYDTSQILESLAEVSGVQSFMLAVDPDAPTDIGFLGGSLIGREFWRGMRGGGEPGARTFKAHCGVHLLKKATLLEQPPPPPPTPPTPLKSTPAMSVKAELYERVRSALRLASGVRTAEMKWTNTERLDVYGVTLVGWPESVPAQNPSSLKMFQNKLLLEALEKGTMRFERIAGSSRKEATPQAESPEEDFSWAYNADAEVAPASSSSVPPPPETVSPSARTSLPPLEPSNMLEPAQTAWTDMHEPMESSFNVDYTWNDGDMNENLLSESLTWNEDPDSPVERPRKRHRSEEISNTGID
ncbi:hypothetical protein D9619_004834 [Psilocybe cf. subviscida]|uniref:Uncharacterized protein n=1 Tax=Psilocybe cf. subviscida TaxID=2480587 RepID=A0A8H5BP47_9AGAR|nr:hypothetical protein D9619_004834 [Psilocybe cf. subviscida]